MIVKILILIVLAVLFFSFFAFYTNTHPPRPPGPLRPFDHNLPTQHFTVHTRDGTTLQGLYAIPAVKNAVPAIILNHGLGADKSDFYPLAAHLFNNGFAVVLFDFRAHGESTGSASSLGLREQADLTAVIDAVSLLSGIDPGRIGAYGFSLGAVVALLVAARDTRINCVVADSPFLSLDEMAAHILRNVYFLPRVPFLFIINCWYRLFFGAWMQSVRPFDSITKRSDIRFLFITGDRDTLIPSSHTKKIFEAASGNKELWIISGAGHGATLAVGGDHYYERIYQFFSACLQ